MATLFEKAKQTSPAKKTDKGEVINMPQLAKTLSEINKIDIQLAELSAQRAILDSEIREAGQEEMIKLYKEKKNFPGTIKIVAGEGSFQFITSDKYLKIDADRYNELKEKYGEIVEENTRYYFNNEILEKYQEVISNLIMGSKKIKEEDKAKLLESETSYNVKKGTISGLYELARTFKTTIDSLIQEVKPIFSVKIVKQ